MKVSLLTFADFANATANGKLNILGVFDSMHVESFPYRHHAMVLAVRYLVEYSDSEEKRELEIQIEAPDGEKLMNVKADVEIPTLEAGTFTASNQVINVRNMEFKQSGTYLARVRIDDEMAAEVPLKVVRGRSR